MNQRKVLLFYSYEVETHNEIHYQTYFWGFCQQARVTGLVQIIVRSWVLLNVATPSVLLGGGNTAGAIYDKFLKGYKKGTIRDAKFLTNFEYLGIAPSHNLSRQQYFHRLLVSRLETLEGRSLSRGPNAVRYVPGVVENGTLDSACLDYDAHLKAPRPFFGIQSISPAGELAGICPYQRNTGDLRLQYTGVQHIHARTSAYLKPTPKIPIVVTIGVANLLENVQHLWVPLLGVKKRRFFAGSRSNRPGFRAACTKTP